MECAPAGQLDHTNVAGLELPPKRLDTLHLPGKGDVLRAIHRSDGDHVAVPQRVDRLTRGDLVGENGYHRTLVGVLLRDPPAFSCEPEAIFETEDSRHACRGQGTDAVSDYVVRPYAEALPQTRKRVFKRKEHGLCAAGLVDQPALAWSRKHDRQQGTAQQRLDNPVTFHDCRPEQCVRDQELAAHVLVLCPLTAEQECEAAVRSRRRPAQVGATGNSSGGELLKPGYCLLTPGYCQAKPMRHVRAADIERVADIAEGGLRVLT